MPQSSERHHSPIVENRQLTQLTTNLCRQNIRLVTPSPVSAYGARQVHSGLTAKTQHILQGNDGDVCHGRHDGANEYPIDRLILKAQVGPGEIAFPPNVFCGPSALSNPRTGPPTNGRIIVVSARVRHQFARIIMRAEAGSLRIVSESKLEQAHAWESKLLAKAFHFWSDHTQIFRNKW